MATTAPSSSGIEMKTFYEYSVVNGVRIPVFPKNSSILPSNKDELLRFGTQLNFSVQLLSVLKKIIKNKKIIDICSEKLSIPYYLIVDKDKKELTTQDNPKSFAYKVEYPLINKTMLDTYLKRKNLGYGPDSPLKKELLSELQLNSSGDLIAHEFNECTDAQYFIPLTIFKLYDKVSHQNLLVFNKTDKNVTWIEPQYSSANNGTENSELIRIAITNILKNAFDYDFKLKETDGDNARISKLVNEYTIDFPTKTCPQAITEDTNCMFWTLLLTTILVLNPSSKIDEVSNAVMTKYASKEELSAYMNNFKWFLSEAKGGKRRRTYRRKLGNRTRKLQR